MRGFFKRRPKCFKLYKPETLECLLCKHKKACREQAKKRINQAVKVQL